VWLRVRVPQWQKLFREMSVNRNHENSHPSPPHTKNQYPRLLGRSGSRNTDFLFFFGWKPKDSVESNDGTCKRR
jgi:hypothetical protein